jgi:tetratricopeptide (TPR) repeat protein
MVQRQGRSAEAIAVAQQGIRLSEMLADQAIESEARAIYCQALYTQSEFDAALEQAQQPERLALAVQHPRLVALAQSRQGDIARLRGDTQRAIPLFESALGFYQAENDLSAIADMRNQLGLLYFDLNAMPQARVLLTECYDLANHRLLRFPAHASQKASINMTAGCSPTETLANENVTLAGNVTARACRVQQ